MSTNTKPKKLGFGKSLILIAAILIVLHWISDGESTAFIKDIFQGETDPGSTSTAAPTTPPQADRLPSVPEALWDHVYLDTRGQGSCDSFTGNVTVLVVFVDDPEVAWTPEETETAKQEIETILERIRLDTAAFGASLDLKADYITGNADTPLVRDTWITWANSVLNTLSLLDTPSTIPTDYESHYQADSVPILFLTNQKGRALARSIISGSLAFEGALIFEDTSSIYHELCHVFGAKDFYFPKEVSTLAETYLPESIMSESSTGSVDSLTAYLMGWTDRLSSEALQFLEQTAYLTAEYLAEQKELDSYTGYVENFPHGNGIYTGYLVDGIRHGQGKHTLDGAVWEGNFVHGSLQGKGTFLSAAGNFYDGEWLDGTFHGQGTHSWADGAKYVGNFDHGTRSGQGTMYYNDGAVYVGQWHDNLRSGQGRLTYASGSYCEGTWVEGTLNGEGVFCWSENEKYVGHFVDGQRNGYGVYYYSDGARYEGQWQDGECHGQGTVYYANGSSKSGTWVHGKFAE